MEKIRSSWNNFNAFKNKIKKNFICTISAEETIQLPASDKVTSESTIVKREESSISSHKHTSIISPQQGRRLAGHWTFPHFNPTTEQTIKMILIPI